MAEIEDGVRPSLRSQGDVEAPPIIETLKPKLEGTVKKKRRRGKTKRKITKPFLKLSWPERRKNDNSKRNNRFRKMVLANTHAPFNNNQFLMEIHKPEPENNFEILRTPSARTRDSSFSVDSEDNYFYSLPDDEEEYLTKEFSSVYEDAQSERLSNMSKSDLIQEYLLLEAKYDNLIKRNERLKPKYGDDKDTSTDKDTSITDKESLVTERNTSATSMDSTEENCDLPIQEIMQRLKCQEEQMRELEKANEKLRFENERLRKRSKSSSSEDSESDSSSTSVSDSSSYSMTPVRDLTEDGNDTNGDNNLMNGDSQPIVNGIHNPDANDSVHSDEI